MQQFLRLCLWQVIIFTGFSASSVMAEEVGISIKGPKSSDIVQYEQYGPITARDTLWNIALKVRPDNTLSIYQVMQSLFARNPQAFADNNQNHLVTGAYLQVPSLDEMRAINKNLAQSKSNADDKNWEKKVVQIATKKETKPEELSVKKKDLDAAKVEINEQLQTFGNDQTERLSTIQRDVLDSIDGLQALLKENEGLRSKLSSFNDQLNVMQDEVAKSKEIKLQMNDMLALQQALLDKAEEREAALRLEKEKLAEESNSFISSAWFQMLIFTIPTLLLVGGGLWFFLKRKAKDEPTEEIKTAKETIAPEQPKEEASARN
ncbi:FimV/HubP family polar landmark protein [Pseudocolwellia sp. HL-MZ19]|uniref:FimV/HubP family polar landmark protein n=1 Tax=Pseudocolwellia sp. HL-MZ19 TaxID=3400846 RepID=UPI003CEC9778